MRIHWTRFNIYLLFLAAAVVWSGGCNTPAAKRRRVSATLRLHQEMRPDASGRTTTVEILRSHPFSLNIEKEPFVNEKMVKEAKVIDAMGGFALQVQLDHRGTFLLEQYSAALRGKHLAIFSQFTTPKDPKLSEGRWLSAPLVEKKISDGLLLFTPDATREEADQIALGLNNVAKKEQVKDVQ